MHEYIRASGVQLGENWIPRRVAQVRAADVREQLEAVEVELVAAAPKLIKACSHVGKWEGPERGETIRVGAAKSRSVIVHRPGQIQRLAGVAVEYARRG